MRRFRFGIRVSWLALLCTLIFLVGPLVVVIFASFDSGAGYHVEFPPRDPSLHWYTVIPRSYRDAMVISVVTAMAVAVLAGVIGTMAALALVRGRLVARELLRSFFLMPVQIPLVVTGAMFLEFYYHLSGLFGLNLIGSLPGLVLAHLLVAVPYCIGSISSVLARADEGLEEAAQSLGATHWRTFWRVTFPVIRPGIAAGMFYSFIVSFGDVPISVFLVNTRTMTLPVQMFNVLQFDFDPTLLAVSSLILVASVVVILLMQRFAGLNLVLPSKRA